MRVWHLLMRSAVPLPLSCDPLSTPQAQTLRTATASSFWSVVPRFLAASWMCCSSCGLIAKPSRFTVPSGSSSSCLRKSGSRMARPTRRSKSGLTVCSHRFRRSRIKRTDRTCGSGPCGRYMPIVPLFNVFVHLALTTHAWAPTRVLLLDIGLFSTCIHKMWIHVR